MRIQSSDCSFSSADISSVSHQTRETLRAWDNETELMYDSASSSETTRARLFNTQDIVDLHSSLVPKDPETGTAETDTVSEKQSKVLKEAFVGTIRDHMIKSIVERMTGKKIHVFNPELHPAASKSIVHALFSKQGEKRRCCPVFWSVRHR